MQVTLVTQPFDEQGSLLYDFLNDIQGDATLRLDVVVAWAKRSGLARVEDVLLRLRNEGAHLRLLVGIDEGGATRQGLEMARTLFHEVFIFHDPSGRTFHPKVYAAIKDTAADLFVGSNNLTAGGVYFNYEAAVKLALERPRDEILVQQVVTYIERLLGDSLVCNLLDDELLQSLISGPYQIGDEEQSRTSNSARNGATQILFGKSAQPKRSDPGARRTRLPRGSTLPALGADDFGSSTVVKRWFKELKRTDAQHVNPGSNPTGNLRLVRAGLDLDQTTYFRSDFFASEVWAQTPKPKGTLEEAIVSFDVTITYDAATTEHLGFIPLRIDDAEWREANQGNHTSVLHWGPLMKYLTGANYVGHYVCLELRSDGTYRLVVTPDRIEATEFIP
jgi:HKD family nuclease